MNLHGLRLDSIFSDSAQQTWAHARNILLSRGFDEIENEPGDTLIDSSINGDIIGRITTPSEIILFTWESNHGYIKHLSAVGTLTTIVTIHPEAISLSPTTYPTIYVEGVHCYNSEGDLIVAWTHGVHKPMILNVTHALATPIVITTEPDLKTLYLFPEFNHNTFALTTSSATTTNSIIAGGRLPAAAYFISLAYEIEPDVNTNFGIISNPIFITDEESTTTYRQFKGNTSLVITNKAININITNLDILYDYFKLAIIQKTETGTNCFITKRIKRPATKSLTDVVTVLIDTLDKLSLFNIAEVTTSSPSFNTIKTITQSNKRIRIGNLTKVEKVSLADIYNNVISKVDVNWIDETQASLSSTKGSYKDSVFIFNSKGFRDDEVYALYLGLRLKSGGFYGIYHIPGRAEIGNEHGVNTIDGTNYDAYKVSSTATLVGNYYGKMGFWENEDEVYPTGYGTIATQKVRHHRFPSAKQIQTWKGSLVSATKKGELIETTTVTADKFAKSTDIYYGVLTPTITPLSGTFLPASLTGNNDNRYTALYNQTISLDFIFTAFVSLYNDGTDHKGNSTLTIKKYTKTGINTYTPTTLLAITKTASTDDPEQLVFSYTGGTILADVELLVGDYISIEIAMSSCKDVSPAGLGLTVTNAHFDIYNTSIGQEILGLRVALDWATVSAGTKANLESVVDGWEIFYAKRTLNNQLMIDQSLVFSDATGFRFYGFDSMSNLLNIEPTHVKADLYTPTADVIVSTDINEVIHYTTGTSMINKLTKIKYLPAYNSATVPSNETRENCYYFEAGTGAYDRYLVNFINIKDNVYLDFSSQELVSCGIVKKLTDTGYFSFYGGDTFIGHNSVLRFEGTTAKIWYFPIQSILNSGMRYEGLNDYEKFYPLTDITKYTSVDGVDTQLYIDAMKAAGIANYYLYNNDYHILNTLRQDNIDTELTSLVTKFPNRIYSSMPQPLESTSMYWRRFKILDYFDMINNKGAIYKMIGNEYIVYVKTEFSIFRGIVVDKLVTGNIDVALKSSEMFDRPLQELLDADGNYIKSWNREGIILTPYGLVVADLDKGSIYIISDKATEISKLGIEDWFRKIVTSTITSAEFGTKESIGKGVILGYDDIYKRLLVTIKSTSSNIANFTLSFQLEKMQWICFHRYTPDKYIWNSNGMYRIDGISISKMFNNGFGYTVTIASLIRSGTGGVTVTCTTTGSHNLKTGDTILISGANITVCNGTFIITVTGLTTFTFTVLASTTGAVTGASIIASDPSYIDFIFNNNKGERFLLKHVRWVTNIENAGINIWDETIDKLMVYSKNLCSGEISIVKEHHDYNAISNGLEQLGNTLYYDGEWVYNDVVDYLTTPNSVFLDANGKIITSALNLSKNYFEKSFFIGKFIIARLIYNNSSVTKKLRISNVTIETKNIL
jgi:hypothetical protein